MPWSRTAGISGTELGCYSHFTTEVDNGMRNAPKRKQKQNFIKWKWNVRKRCKTEGLQHINSIQILTAAEVNTEKLCPEVV